LSLAWNNIGLDHDNFGAFCSALQLNGHIQILDLSHNQLSPTNGKTLSDALKLNGCIKSVDLRSNHIGYSGASALLKMLRKNSSLTCLKLSGNHIPQETLEAIGECHSGRSYLYVGKNLWYSCLFKEHFMPRLMLVTLEIESMVSCSIKNFKSAA